MWQLAIRIQIITSISFQGERILFQIIMNIWFAQEVMTLLWYMVFCKWKNYPHWRLQGVRKVNCFIQKCVSCQDPLHTTTYQFELVGKDVFMLLLGLSTPCITRELIIINLTDNNVLSFWNIMVQANEARKKEAGSSSAILDDAGHIT